MDGNRSSAQAAFKVPKVPKKPAESAARRPSATGGKLGTETNAHTVYTLRSDANAEQYV